MGENNEQLSINNDEENMGQEKSNVVQKKAYRYAIRIVKTYQYLKFEEGFEKLIIVN